MYMISIVIKIVLFVLLLKREGFLFLPLITSLNMLLTLSIVMYVNLLLSPVEKVLDKLLLLLMMPLDPYGYIF